IKQIARYLGKRASEALAKGKTLILLGDFNVVDPSHKTMQALLESGFEVPEAIRRPTNVDQNKFYDQIAFKTRPGFLDYLGNSHDGNKHSGSVDIFAGAFADEQRTAYQPYFDSLLKEAERKARANAKKKGRKAPKAKDPDAFYRKWRTWQLSDHRPLWVQLKANESGDYLKSLLAHKGKAPA
ncbi:MAG TPA: hypothetical protein VFW48_12155, partial [Solirubrobacterales bacterium]|nr:hypothetical protein [Solirubrobacterales bacterium]